MTETSGPTICIIEDEVDIQQLLSYHLTKSGYRLYFHDRGSGAISFLRQHQPTLILLDVMIPDQDGFSVCEAIKADPSLKTVPLVMMSAKDDDANIVRGLELGADDYVTKPFRLSILLARLHALLRRSSQTAQRHDHLHDEHVLTYDGLRLYLDRHEVYNQTSLIPLSHTEFQLLSFLAQSPSRVFSRSQIIDGMKGESYFVTDRLVDVLLVSLRKKLGKYARFIQTVRGVGYKFKPTNQVPE